MNATTEQLPFFLIRVHSHGKQEEGILTTPREAAAPLIVFLHDRFGSGYHNLYMSQVLRNHGFATLTPTLPGFGFSKSDQDWGGPASIDTCISLIQEAKKILGYEPKIGLWGAGYGATVGSKLLLSYPHFSAAVIQSGLYDLVWGYKSLLIKNDLKEKLLIATGGFHEELLARSFTRLVDDSYMVPTLLLHGEDDERAPLAQARALFSILKKNGTPVDFFMFPKRNHYLGPKIRDERTLPFLKEHLM